MVISITAALVACGGASATRPRVAVIADAWRSPASLPGVRARDALVEGLEESGAVEARRSDAICDDDVECLRAAGVASRVERVAAPDLAALGTTVVLRVSVVNVDGATREQTLQRVVRDATASRVHAVARGLGLDLARSLSPPVPSEWYQEWWPWTIGGTLVATAIAIGITAALLSAGRGPDVTVIPP